MLCPSCGRTVGELVKLCEYCAQGEKGHLFALTAEEEIEMLSPWKESASLVHRCGASIVDLSLIHVLAIGVTEGILRLFNPLSVYLLGQEYESVEGYRAARLVASPEFQLGAALAVLFVLWSVYYVVTEGFWGFGTPGKRLFGLRVCNELGQPMTLRLAVKRHLLRAMSTAWFLSGYIMAFCSPKRSAWHDQMSSTTVYSDTDIGPVSLFIAVISALLLYTATAFFLAELDIRFVRSAISRLL